MSAKHIAAPLAKAGLFAVDRDREIHVLANETFGPCGETGKVFKPIAR